MIDIQKISAYGWPNCVRIANSQIEVIVTSDVGPRIIHFGHLGGQNLFGVNAQLQGQTGGEAWQGYGGHRLWHAPEVYPRSYAPDNGPVIVEEHRNFVRFIQPTEAATGIQKEIEIRLSAEAAQAQITHRLTNHTVWAVEVAPWALSVMAPGGTAIIPLPPRHPHDADSLLATSRLALFSYTNLADPRWVLGNKYFLLKQDPQNPEFQKLGVHVSDGWAGYALNRELFVKTFPCQPPERYGGFGSPFEVFTNAEILEMETVAPLDRLEPEASVEHVEHWRLFADVPAPRNDAEVEAHILPRIKTIGA